MQHSRPHAISAEKQRNSWVKGHHCTIMYLNTWLTVTNIWDSHHINADVGCHALSLELVPCVYKNFVYDAIWIEWIVYCLKISSLRIYQNQNVYWTINPPDTRECTLLVDSRCQYLSLRFQSRQTQAVYITTFPTHDCSHRKKNCSDVGEHSSICGISQTTTHLLQTPQQRSS